MQGLSHEARPSSSHRISSISNAAGSVSISTVACTECAWLVTALTVIHHECRDLAMKQGQAAPTGSRPSQMPPAASLSAPLPARMCLIVTALTVIHHQCRDSAMKQGKAASMGSRSVNGSIYNSIITCAGCIVFLCAQNLSNCNAIEISASKLHPQQLHASASDIAFCALLGAKKEWLTRMDPRGTPSSACASTNTSFHRRASRWLCILGR